MTGPDSEVGRDDTERSIQHYLDHRLEQFSNGGWRGDKTSGYAAAKVPDWQLRRWATTHRQHEAQTAALVEAYDRLRSLAVAMLVEHPDIERQKALAELPQSALAAYEGAAK